MELFVKGYSGQGPAHHEGHLIHLCKDQKANAPAAEAYLMAGDDGDYAGDVSPSYAFDVLKAEADALLVDVRTKAEWGFVGVPNLSDLGKAVGFIEWLTYPDMARNESFLTELARFAEGDQQRAVFFLCRSGQRSQSAAIAATAQGFTRAYNVEGGFEGPLDRDRHRGQVGGWKAAGLPWAQT